MFTVRFTAAAFLFVLLFSACGKKPELPAEEVIRRAIIRSNAVQSVAVSLEADMHTEESQTLSGSVIMQAVLKSGGQAWSADSLFNLESSMKRGHERASGRLLMVSPGTGQTYLRLESVQGVLGELLRKSFTGSNTGWMVYGEDSGSKQLQRTTPDPAVMSSYAETLSVTENLGIVDDDSGRESYHFRVALKPQMLSSLPQGGTTDAASMLRAHGELWIDTDDFSLSKVLWNVSGIPTLVGPVTLHISARFTDYDVASIIESPSGSAATLPLESIFAIFSS